MADKQAPKTANEKPGRKKTSGPDLIKDGGKWAGSGRKVVEHGEGPEVVAQRQSQTGRGALRTTLRQSKSKHPGHE